MYRDRYGRAYIIFDIKKIEREDAKVKEQWRTVCVGTMITAHEVSNTGKVRNRFTKVLRKQEEGNDGYRRITIYGKRFLIHRLVAMAFIPIPRKYRNIPRLEVNHKDGHKWHNYAYNLEWCTGKENTIHAHKTGLAKRRRKKK